jgi:hypothetical protein
MLGTDHIKHRKASWTVILKIFILLGWGGVVQYLPSNHEALYHTHTKKKKPVPQKRKKIFILVGQAQKIDNLERTKYFLFLT